MPTIRAIVHRDLKPSNIMLGSLRRDPGHGLGPGQAVRQRDEPADEAEEDAPSPSPSPGDLTATGAVLGTPQYMSPEQARGEPVGPASDIFSLGLLLYAILTGKSAFDEAGLRGAGPPRGGRGMRDPAAAAP